MQLAGAEMGSRTEDSSLETYAYQAPVTGERPLNTNLEDQLPKPYLARALAAVDKDHPTGMEGRNDRGLSVLQQHVAFFDRNMDGVVYPWDTFRGFHAIGCNFFVSFGAAILINLVFSYITQTGWIPSPFLPIYINNIHKCKHGSDSETYDTEGRFEPSKFEAIFSKYATSCPDALSKDELSTMLRANRNLLDFIGWIASYLEWQLLYYLGKDEQGLLQRETIRGVYDGSLFEQLQKRASSSKRP